MLYGQQAAEHKLLKAYTSGRCHHAWVLAGPRGIGKATLAYRFARFVLANPTPDTSRFADLSVDAGHPVAMRIASRGHSDLVVLERTFDEKTQRLKQIIDVDQARKAAGFFNHTAGEGGWRVCIVDAADDLNPAAANALLKIIEEPPPRALFLLIAHTPGRLLATIRSRCIRLDLPPLEGDAIAKIVTEVEGGAPPGIDHLQELSGGSAGRALELLQSGASRKFEDFRKLVSAGAPFDRKTMWSLSTQMSQRSQDAEYRLFCELLEQWLMARAASAARNNSELAGAASWAEQGSQLGHSIRRANALNLDRREVLLNAFESIESTTLALHPK